MTVRDLKLAIASGIENEEVRMLNMFFEDLFSDIQIYTKKGDPNLIFMKNGKYIMEQDLKNGILLCRHDEFWSVLDKQYHCTYTEIEDIIKYKVEEILKIDSVIPVYEIIAVSNLIEKLFEIGSLMPILNIYNNITID